MAVVRPEERVLASGVTNLVRLAGWAVGPAFAGVLMGTVSFATPLVVGAVMKVAYDGLLYAAFRRLRPPEERDGERCRADRSISVGGDVHAPVHVLRGHALRMPGAECFDLYKCCPQDGCRAPCENWIIRPRSQECPFGIRRRPPPRRCRD